MIMQFWEWLKRIFLVYCITIFPKQAQNKNKVKIETTFIDDEKYLKQIALHKFTFISGGTKGYFLKDKQQTY